jgi:hypothetical protein
MNHERRRAESGERRSEQKSRYAEFSGNIHGEVWPLQE